MTQTEKDAPVLRNPFLDGIDPIIRARSTGIRSLRVDRKTAGVQNPATPSASPLTIQPSRPAPASTPSDASRVMNVMFGSKVGAMF